MDGWTDGLDPAEKPSPLRAPAALKIERGGGRVENKDEGKKLFGNPSLPKN